jgi:dUTP pyrophosphatase
MTCNCRKEPVVLGAMKLYEDVQLPQYAHVGDACFDIRAYISKEDVTVAKEDFPAGVDGEGHSFITLTPGDKFIFRTGLVFDIPQGYKLTIHARSGLGIKHQITLANRTGVIDEPYTDETLVCLVNEGHRPFSITHGDRIAQACLEKVEPVVIKEVKEVPVKSRGTNSGLGSSGLQ